MSAILLFSCNVNSICGSRKENSSHSRLFKVSRKSMLGPHTAKIEGRLHGCRKNKLSRRFSVFAATEGSADSSKSEETIPSWARLDSNEPPPWARDEGNQSTSQQSFEIPFFVYLLASAVTAIAAIGSAFEYMNQKPVFGILKSDSIFYAPLLGFFVFTGIPTSAFLWFKSVQVANKEAEEQDRRDGYM